ncbi:hemerythrin domain-containing protein [Salinimicrobium sp. GXAS 041]|uniref:hemerythrin domain-containing protein n=1 Tax=Salinimicrobium sp. GXAS 041 TaxID=3400806 RepID=UPI003C7580C7
MNQPLKRHDSLKPLSREHHQGLLLCWKIREGLKKGISPERIKSYASFFYETQLLPHFAFEEKEIFPLLGEQNPLRKQALNEHQRLEALFTKDYDPEMAVNEIATALEDHIRFEERVLFEEIQHQTQESVLSNISDKLKEKTPTDPDNWEDQFWKK